MKVTIRKTELEAALRVASVLTKPKTSWGEWALLDSREGFISQGLALRLACRLPETRFEGHGQLLLHEKMLRDLLPNLEAETVEVEEGRTRLAVRSGSYRASLPVLAASHYPPGSGGPRGPAMTLPLPPLQQAVKDVDFAIADDVDRSAKSALVGLIIRGRERTLEVIGARDPLVAIARIPRPADPVAAFDLVLPREMGQVIARLPGETVRISGFLGAERVFEAGPVTVRSTLVAGALPDFSIVTERPKRVRLRVGRDALKKALRRTEVLKDRNSKILTIEVGPEVLKLRAVSAAGRAEEPVPAVVEGLGEGKTVFGIDVDYLSGILDRVREETVPIAVGAVTELIAVELAERTYVAVLASPDKDFEE